MVSLPNLHLQLTGALLAGVLCILYPSSTCRGKLKTIILCGGGLSFARSVQADG